MVMYQLTLSFLFFIALRMALSNYFDEIIDEMQKKDEIRLEKTVFNNIRLLMVAGLEGTGNLVLN
jgi:hypothetical protein